MRASNIWGLIGIALALSIWLAQSIYPNFPKQYSVWLWAAITICTISAVLALALPYIIGRQNSERDERRIEAATSFRETFLKELHGLYPRPAEWPPTTGIEPRLRNVFPALQGAVAAYRPFIPRSDQAAFDEAWLVYRTATKREIDTQSYTHYMNITTTTVSSFGGQTVLTNDGKESFKRNVDRLLSFAEHN